MEPRNLGHLPSSPAAHGAIDPERLSELLASFARRFQPHQTALVEHALGLPPSSLASGNLASSIGVDPSRSIQIAVAPIDEAGKRVVAAARSLVPTGRHRFEIEGFSRAVQKAFSANRPSPIHIRVVVPASDTPRLLTALRTLLESRRYVPIAAPEGIESLHARRERAVAISLGPQVVVVDILAFEGVVPSPRMVADAASRSWQALLSPTSQAGLATDGQVARWSYSPAAVSDLGFLEAISREQDRIAIDRDSHPDVGMTFNASLASQFYGFSGAEPLRFRTGQAILGMEAGRPVVATITELGGGLSAEAAVGCAPSVSVDFPGALSRFDVSTSCMRLIEVPGDVVDKGALVQANFPAEQLRFSWLRGTGWLGWPLAMPWTPFALSRVPLSWNAGVGPRAMQRMERFGWSNPAFGAPDVFWGLLPLGASTEAVACAAEEQAAGCKGKRRLKAGGAVHDLGGRFARLVQLGNRLVLLTSKDRKAVESMTPRLTSAPVPAMRATVSEGSTLRAMDSLGMEPEAVRYSAELVVEGSKLVVKAGPSK